MAMYLKGKGGMDYSLSTKPQNSGGDSEIFDINGKPGIVAKIYKPGKATPEKERKLIRMVAFPPNASVLSQIAWPQDVLYENGHFFGFIMPKMNVNEDLNVIYEYGASAKYPFMTWSNKITIAQNLCAVLHCIHETGHVCGDLNPKNISVNPTTGHIIFLDTDSYHIQDGQDAHRCDVGIPEYMAAEVQAKMRGGTNLANASLPTFTKQTDNFALAIHIFQLLMNGVHPFACTILPSQSSVVAPQPADIILRGEFPFMQNLPGIAIPPFAPSIDILPSDIIHLFERAFIIGHSNPQTRPAPHEWYYALKALRENLSTCTYAHHHHYYNALPICPWCMADNKFAKLVSSGRTLAQETLAPPVTTSMPISSPISVPPPQHAGNKALIITAAGVAVALASLIFLISVYFFSPTIHTPPETIEAPADVFHSPENHFVEEPPDEPLAESFEDWEQDFDAAESIEDWYPGFDVAEPVPIVGDIISFGNYNWRVLDVQANQVLIITERVIDTRSYHNWAEAVTWEQSEIRRWLNTEFLRRFSTEELNLIAETYVVNNNNPWFGTNGGNNTWDRVFLLSIEEMVRLFGDSGELNNRPGGASLIDDGFNHVRRASYLDHSATTQWLWWWLRSPGLVPHFTAFVTYDGVISVGGIVVMAVEGGGGIRPALWLILD